MSDAQWTIESILRVTRDFFSSKGIESARLDAELLLSYVLDLNRVQLYTHFDRPLDTEEQDRYRDLVRRRAALEPVAYILGEKEFYGRNFVVGPSVLVPRPETEHLIDAVLRWAAQRDVARIADIGTGSGCIAITLALELSEVSVVATDLSADALKVAKENARSHGVFDRIEWHCCDLFPEGARGFDVVASNPPYIAEGDAEVEVSVHVHEPHLALFSGADGLDLIRRLVAAAPGRLEEPGLLAFELGAMQADSVAALAPDFSFIDDLQGYRRIALWERTPQSLRRMAERVTTGA